MSFLAFKAKQIGTKLPLQRTNAVESKNSKLYQDQTPG
jgi:hypothetical protein